MEPCTELEAEMLSSDWLPDYLEHFEGKGGMILLRNMRVMEDGRSTYTDFGVVDDSACANTAKYRGIFCRGANHENKANIFLHSSFRSNMHLGPSWGFFVPSI